MLLTPPPTPTTTTSTLLLPLLRNASGGGDDDDENDRSDRIFLVPIPKRPDRISGLLGLAATATKTLP